MNFTKATRDTLINDMQCKHITLAQKLNAALEIGNCPDNLVLANNVAYSLTKIFYRYKAFDDTVTYASNITFGENEDNDTVLVSLSINSVHIASYNGTGGGSEIAEYMASYINTYSSTYMAVTSGATLYIYSYDGSLTFSTTTTVTVIPTDTIDATVTTMTEDDLGEILDLWNCITLEDLSNIRCFFLKVLSNQCNC